MWIGAKRKKVERRERRKGKTGGEQRMERDRRVHTVAVPQLESNK